MPDRRTLLKALATASVATAVGPTTASAAAHPRDPVLRARIGNVWHSHHDVLQWEARRLQVAAEKLRGNTVGALLRDLDSLVLRRAVGTRDIVRARELLADVKVEMGQHAIREALAADLAATGVVSPLSALPRRWSVSHADITSDRGSAEGFVAWFEQMVARDHLRDGLVACPDHYRIATLADGRQDVIEVTGGAMLASQFRVDYADTAHVSVAPDPAYSFGVAGSASAPSGQLIGSVRHLTRTTSEGFRASLNVAFPRTLPPWMVAEHRWHLACEFSNWITLYVRESKGRG